MPNWCESNLVFDRQPVGLEDWVNSEDELKAEQLIPLGGVAEDDIVAVAGLWGTKWPPKVFWEGSGHASLTSAWSPPLPLVAALCVKLGIGATMSYFEPGCAYAGRAVFSPEGMVSDECVPWGTEKYDEITYEDYQPWLDEPEVPAASKSFAKALLRLASKENVEVSNALSAGPDSIRVTIRANGICSYMEEFQQKEEK